MKRGLVVFICLFLMISLSFVSAGLFNKNKVTGEVIGQTTFSCESIFEQSQYYFKLCSDNGYGGVCFNKFSGKYQGCGPASGAYCITNNVYSSENIACSTDRIFEECIDSDNGKDYYNSGTITGPDKDGEGNPTSDYCWNDGKGVMEGYCDVEGYVDFISYSCPYGYGCLYGACMKITPECDLIGTDCPSGERCLDGRCVPTTIDCTDSDGGLNYFVKGIAKEKPQAFEPSSTFFSLISDSSAVLYLPDKNLTVKEGETYNYRGMSFRIDDITPNGYSDGSDLIGISSLYFTDQCLDKETLLEYKCEDSYYVYLGELGEDPEGYILFLNKSTLLQYSLATVCPDGCVNGACVQPNSTNYKCTETDNGLNYYAKGITSYNGYDYEDFCVDSYSIVNEGQSNQYILEVGDLVEYSCYYPNNTQRCYATSCPFIKYHCPDGCVEGECVSESRENCSLIINNQFQDKDNDGCHAGTDSDCGGIEGVDNPEITCFDNIDNDCDGMIDSLDNDLSCNLDCGDNICGWYERVSSSKFYCNEDCAKEGTQCIIDADCPNGLCIEGVCGIEISSLNTCEEEGGEICFVGEECVDGVIVEVTNIDSGEICCVAGDCVKKRTGTVCEYGCMLNDKCYPFGYRKAGQYCSENNEFVIQSQSDVACENSFECRSNLCIDDECVHQGLFKKILNWFKRRSS